MRNKNIEIVKQALLAGHYEAEDIRFWIMRNYEYSMPLGTIRSSRYYLTGKYDLRKSEDPKSHIKSDAEIQAKKAEYKDRAAKKAQSQAPVTAQAVNQELTAADFVRLYPVTQCYVDSVGGIEVALQLLQKVKSFG